MKSAVVDVNVVVAAMLTPLGATRQILSAWQRGDFALLISEGIIAEITEKLSHPKIGRAYKVTDEDIDWVRGLLLTQAEVIIVAPGDVVQVTGDPEDDYVLATTRLGRANYLVTGDRKLLALGQYEKATIISPREFLDIVGGKSPS